MLNMCLEMGKSHKWHLNDYLHALTCECLDTQALKLIPSIMMCRDLISSADTILEMSQLCERVVSNVKGLRVSSSAACRASFCPNMEAQAEL